MLFFKAVFLLVITGPPAVSKRLNKKQALSQVQKHQELRRKTAVEQDRGDEPRTIPTNTAGEIPNAIHVKSKFEMCLNARSGNLRRGDLIQIHSCSGAPNEQFEMWDDHTIRVKSKPEMCLNPTPRNPIKKLVDYGNKVITSRDWVIPGIVIPVWYQGDVIQLQRCSAAANEQFEMLDDSTIRAVKSNPPLCFSAGTGGLKQRDVIHLSPCSAVSPTQQFLVPARAAGKAAAEVTPIHEALSNGLHLIKSEKYDPASITKAMLKTGLQPVAWCLIFSNKGNDEHPTRHDWGAGNDDCGLEGGKDGLIANKQGVWKIQQLVEGMYMIKSTVDDKCLIFGDYGNDRYPTRHDWGAGNDYCGFPGGRDALIGNRQGVWKIQQLVQGKYMIKSALDGKCLIFDNHGSDRYPSRHDWGDANDYCGIPGGKDGLIANKQGVWLIDLIDAEADAKKSAKKAAGEKAAAEKAAAQKAAAEKAAADKVAAEKAAAEKAAAEKAAAEKSAAENAVAEKAAAEKAAVEKAAAEEAAAEKAAAEKAAAEKAAAEKAAAEKELAQKAAAEKAAADKVAAEKAAAEKAAAQKAAVEKAAAEKAAAQKAAADKAAAEKAAVQKAAAEKAAAEKAVAQNAAAEKAAADKVAAEKVAAEKAVAEKAAAEKAAAEKSAAEISVAEKAAAEKAAVEKAAAEKVAAEKAAAEKAAAEKAAAEKAVAEKAAAEEAAAQKAAAEKAAAEKAAAENSAAEKAAAEKAAARKAQMNSILVNIAAEKAAAEKAVAQKAAAEKAAADKVAAETAAAEKAAAEKAAAQKAAAEKATAEKAAAEKAAAEEAAAQKAAVEKAAAEKAAAQKAAAAEQSQDDPEKPRVPPGTPEEKSVAQAALAPAEVALARWAAASPASETVGEPEDSQASPAMKTAGESAEGAEGKNKSFAHLSTAPGFTVYALALAVTAAAEIAGAR